MALSLEERAVEEQYAAVIGVEFVTLVTQLALAEAENPAETVGGAVQKFARGVRLAKKAKLLALDVIRGKTLEVKP